MMEGNKCFVGGLPQTATDADLWSYFGYFGTVSEASIVYDGESGKSRGFAYVTFKDGSAANAAVASYNTNEIKGKWVEVKISTPQNGKGGKAKGKGGKGKGSWNDWSTPNWNSNQTKPALLGLNPCAVQVTNLPHEATDQDLQIYFAQFGLVDKVKLKVDANGVSKCIAVVHFKTKDVAQSAVEYKPHQIGDRVVTVMQAPKEESEPTKVMISGLPREATNDDIKGYCTQFGEVVKVDLKTDTNGWSKGICFVSFKDKDVASTCVEYPEAHIFGEKTVDIKESTPALEAANQSAAKVAPVGLKGGKGKGMDKGAGKGVGKGMGKGMDKGMNKGMDKGMGKGMDKGMGKGDMMRMMVMKGKGKGMGDMMSMMMMKGKGKGMMDGKGMGKGMDKGKGKGKGDMEGKGRPGPY